MFPQTGSKNYLKIGNHENISDQETNEKISKLTITTKTVTSRTNNETMGMVPLLIHKVQKHCQ